MEHEEQVFSVEQSIDASAESTEMEDKGRQQEEQHHKKGGFLLCLQLVFQATEDVLLFPDSSSSAPNGRPQSQLMSALYCLCGMERQKKGNYPEMPTVSEQTACSLKEDPCMKHIVNINLILCLCVVVFLFAYWA